MDKQNRIVQILKVLTWVLIVLSIGAFWISIRTDFYSLEYSLVALALWGIAFLINYLVKKKTGKSTLPIGKKQE